MNEEPSWLTPDEQHAWRNFVRLQSKLIGRISRDLQTESNLSTADYAVLVNLPRWSRRDWGGRTQ
ncbi:hypothetical protein [Streptomyces scopuliridis]|uniref:hypothetical protein n=1 Tax=Streptomyces scopuliridis TaxID=452529 RepID=UPI0036C8433B